MASELGVQTIQHTNGTDALTIGSDGSVTTQGAFLPGGLTAWPAFSASYTGPSDWYALGSGAVLAFNNVTSSGDEYMGFNNGGHYNTSTYAFTCPIDGIYFFTFNLYTANADTANGFSLAKNGTYMKTGSGTDINNTYVAGADDISVSSSFTLYLASGDTIDVRSNTPSDLYSGHSWWHGHLVAPL